MIQSSSIQCKARARSALLPRRSEQSNHGEVQVKAEYGLRPTARADMGSKASDTYFTPVAEMLIFLQGDV